MNTDPADVTLVPLPFFEIQEVLLKPTSLIPLNQSKIDSIVQREFKFNISNASTSTLSPDSKQLPCYEIQLRMALCDRNGEQPDKFPKKLNAKLNGKPLDLPPFEREYHASGVEVEKETRYSRPVNITSAFFPLTPKSYNLSIEWKNSEEVFLIGIWLVRHVSSSILFDNAILNAPRYYQESINKIRESLIGTDDDILPEDSIKISLKCALSQLRINIPTRSKNCVHLQCFDLKNYLMMNEKRNTWKCPICKEPCYYADLIIDDYFSEILKSVDDITKSSVELSMKIVWNFVNDEKIRKKLPAKENKPFHIKSEKIDEGDSSIRALVKCPPEKIIIIDDSDQEEELNSLASSNIVNIEDHKDEEKNASVIDEVDEQEHSSSDDQSDSGSEYLPSTLTAFPDNLNFTPKTTVNSNMSTDFESRKRRADFDLHLINHKRQKSMEFYLMPKDKASKVNPPNVASNLQPMPVKSSNLQSTPVKSIEPQKQLTSSNIAQKQPSTSSFKPTARKQVTPAISNNPQKFTPEHFKLIRQKRTGYYDWHLVKKELEDFLKKHDNIVVDGPDLKKLLNELNQKLYQRPIIPKEALKKCLKRINSGNSFWSRPDVSSNLQYSVKTPENIERAKKNIQAIYDKLKPSERPAFGIKELKEYIELTEHEKFLKWGAPEVLAAFKRYHVKMLMFKTVNDLKMPLGHITREELEYELWNELVEIFGFEFSEAAYTKATSMSKIHNIGNAYRNSISDKAFEKVFLGK